MEDKSDKPFPEQEPRMEGWTVHHDPYKEADEISTFQQQESYHHLLVANISDWRRR